MTGEPLKDFKVDDMEDVVRGDLPQNVQYQKYKDKASVTINKDGLRTYSYTPRAGATPITWTEPGQQDAYDENPATLLNVPDSKSPNYADKRKASYLKTVSSNTTNTTNSPEVNRLLAAVDKVHGINEMYQISVTNGEPGKFTEIMSRQGLRSEAAGYMQPATQEPISNFSGSLTPEGTSIPLRNQVVINPKYMGTKDEPQIFLHELGHALDARMTKTGGTLKGNYLSESNHPDAVALFDKIKEIQSRPENAGWWNALLAQDPASYNYLGSKPEIWARLYERYISMKLDKLDPEAVGRSILVNGPAQRSFARSEVAELQPYIENFLRAQGHMTDEK